MKFVTLRNAWIVFAILFITLFSYFRFSDDDINPENITSHIPSQSRWEISPPTEEDSVRIETIFSQPFLYLSEGGQSYVFVSGDQNYVLKFFKFKRFRPQPLVQLLPDIFPFKSYRDQHIAKREKKLTTAFNGYKLAYELHRQESGLIFIQLNPSPLSKWILLIDKENKQRKINLENVSYILQVKGEMLSVDLSRILNEGNLSLAKQRIDQVLTLYLSEYQKGIYDLDHGVMHNIGFLGNQVFHLDVGKFIADERMKQPEYYQTDLIKIASKLRSWIQQHYPQYSQELTIYLEDQVSHLLDKKFKFP
jgi:hypothetical protein